MIAKQKYLILRERGDLSSSRGQTLSPTFLPQQILEVDDLTAADAAEKNRKKGQWTAPCFPVSLVSPLSAQSTDHTDETPPTRAWGVSAVGADTSPYTGKDVVVAILDTGIDASHEAFHGMNPQRKNFTSGPDIDDVGHGTHCAGTIFGRDVEGLSDRL